MKRAFTILEVLTCIAIIAVVAAISFPVFSRSKHAAQVSKSISNLHQMHLALKLYQFDYDGDGKYGGMSDMGLPPGEVLLRKRMGTPIGLWQSPCGQNPSWEPTPTVIQYDYYPDSGIDPFDKISPIYQENLIMFGDMNCSEPGEPLYSDYTSHRGLGVLLSGALLNLNKPGDSRRQKWWSSPPSQ